MRISRVSVSCSNCGASFETEIRVSASSGDFGLDGKPDNADFLPAIYDCPECGYAGYKIDGDKPKIPEAFAVNRDDPYDKYERALVLATTDDVRNHLLMEYTWQLEFDGKNAEALSVRERAVSQMGRSLSIRPVIELAFIYIDFLRQLGRFDEAEETLNSISPIVTADAGKRPKFYQLLLFLQRLIKDRDKAPHMISEV